MNSVYFVFGYFTSSLLASAIPSVSSVNLYPEMDYVHLCSNTSFEATCISQTPPLVWRSSAAPELTVTFNPILLNNRSVGDFLFQLVTTNPYTSTATLSIVQSEHNGTTLSCASTTIGSPSPDQIARVTILVQGPPSAPLSPKFLPQSFTSVELSWTSLEGHSLCVTSYIITLINITEGNVPYTYETSTNATSKTVSDLTQGQDYSFTVVGVDKEGRMGEKSMPSEVITLDVPEKVTNLISSFSSAVITFTWLPPPLSSRPPVIGYNISHNVTGRMVVEETNYTVFTAEVVVPGVYIFTVMAVNVLGVGKEESIIASDDHVENISPSSIAGPLFSIIISSSIFNGSGDKITNIAGTTTKRTITPTLSANTDSLTITIILPAALVGAVFIIIIVICVVLTMKLVYYRNRRKRTNNIENVYQSQQIISQYSMITLDSHTSCIAPPLTTVQKEDCAYADVGPVQVNSRQLSSPVSPNQLGVQYAVLGERSNNAPSVLPPEVTVVYSEITSKNASVTSSSDYVTHEEGVQSENVTPALPPKPL